MGFGDFRLQNNNDDKKLNDIKHGVRRDQIEAKFKNVFDIYDVNKDGTLESRELSELERSLQDFAGEDKILTEGENKVASTIFTSITGVKNVDISGFLKNLSDASELIESTSQTLGEDGGNIITTKYKDGGTEVIAYYPDGEYKFKKIDINTTSTKYYYTIGTNLNKKFTAEDIENAVKKAYKQEQERAKQPKVIEGLSYSILPSYSDFKKAYLKQYNVNRNSETEKIEKHDVEMSERAKQDVNIRDFVLSHYIETSLNIKIGLELMGILDDIGAAINAGSGELYTACKNIYNKYVGDGTTEDYQNFYEMVKQLEPNIERAEKLKQPQIVMQKNPEIYLEGFKNHTELRFSTAMGEKFKATAEQYQNAQIMEKKLNILNEAKKEIELYESTQAALIHGGTSGDGFNPAEHLVNANNLMKEYFGGETEAANLVLKDVIGNSSKTIETLNALIADSKKINETILDGKSFDEIKNDYNQQYKEIFNVDFTPDALSEKISDAKATGSMVKLAAITIISIAVTRSPALAALARGEAIAEGAAANVLKTLITKYGSEAVKQGIKFAMTSGTLAADTGLTLLNQVTSESGINTEELKESTKGSAKYIYFGAYIGAPIAQEVGKSLGKLGLTKNLFKGGTTKTYGAVSHTSISGEQFAKNLIEHGKQLSTKLLSKGGALGSEIGMFSALEIATDGTSVKDALTEQSSFLPKIKIMNHVLEYMLGAKAHTTTMSGTKIEDAIKNSGIKDWNIKEIKAPKGTMYTVDIKGIPLGKFKDVNSLTTAMLEKVAECYQKIEINKPADKPVEAKSAENIQKVETVAEDTTIKTNPSKIATQKTDNKNTEFKLEKNESVPNQCGVLELQDISDKQAGVVNYDLREINGQKVLHFEGLKSNISGAGVGSKLIKELVKLSNELGAEGRVVATASPMMSPNGKLTNMGFYYKLGFKATDATKDAEIRKLLAEGKEIPVSLNVFTDIELTPDGIVKNTLSSKEAKKLEPMQKQYPEIVNSIIQEYAGKLTNEEIIEKAGNAISEKINEALPHAQVTNYTPKVEIEMPINETRFDNGNKTLDVNLPDGVSEGVPMPTKIKAELGTTSIHLANEYKEALTACVEQAKNTFGENKLSTVKNVSTRSKGAASIEPKLEKGLRKKGHLDYNAAKECIGDAVGARIITKNLRKLSDKEITDRINNMKVDNKPLTAEQKELLKKYIYEEKFDSDAKKLEGFYLFEQFTRPLVKERTSEVVNELLLSMAKFLMIDKGLSIEQIERTGLLSDKALIERLKTDDSIEPLEVLQVNNYTGIYGLPEFTVDQTFAIQKLLSLNDKKGIVYTRADIGKDLYTNTGYTSPEEVLRAQNGDELPKSIKSSGYRTAQMNVVFKNGTLGEIQFRGEETNKIGEYEHIAYDLRQGKNTLGSLFNDFKDAISKLSPEEYSEYNNYLEACYNYYNRIELGLPVNKPKLPSKFNPILSEENMKELHDKNEARLNDLKKNFKEGKVR